VPERNLDREFVSAFEDCTLSPDRFTHRDHVRLAWLYLKEDPPLAALTRFATNLKRYATSLGAAGKYHETITWAFIFLVHERMQHTQAETFEAFTAGNEDLLACKPTLERYYRPETLGSELARRAFVMPDR
jgi:hypothetical protein